MKNLRITPLFFLILLSSCYQETVHPQTTQELIAGENEFGKTYQVDFFTLEIGTVTPFECVTDNFITYYPNGRYEINEGATKCNPDDSPAVIGFWSLDRSETFLSVEIGDSIQVWEIESVKNSSHAMTSSFQEGLRTYTFVSSN